MARLATLSPLMGRMPVDVGGSALQAIGGRTPALAAALFSSSARRMLRRRGPLDRAAAPGATWLATLITAANHCPDPQQLSADDTKITDLASTAAEKLAGQLSERTRSVLTEFYSADHADPAQAAQIAESLDVTGLSAALVGVAAQRPPASECRPLTDLPAFADSVAAGVDPTTARPVVVDRVLAGLTGLREPVLAEPDIAPELDIPLWSFLKDNAPDWLLPGAGDIPPDRVLAVQSNPVFTEALLLGANYQTLGELRWRNIAITARWTPLRRFWQRIDVGGGLASVDIRPVIALDTDPPLWPDGTELGDTSHLSDPKQGASLVVVFHAELFRRYPATAVYLTHNPDGEQWLDVPRVDDSPAVERKYPSFTGSLNPDLIFFGFDVAPSAGRDHWVVLEEPPPGYRFLRPGADGSPDAAGVTDAAAFANKTFMPPTRVFLGNLL